MPYDMLDERRGHMDETLNRLREWRERHRLTLLEGADLLGISESMLSRLERGERRVRPLDRVRFARLLGVRVGEIFPR